MRRIRLCLLLLATVLLAAGGATPTASAKGAEREQLFTATLDAMPPAPVALARITFTPGSGLSMTANPGPALHFVEEGSFDVLMLGSGALERAGATTPAQATPVTSNERLTIRPGDLLVIPANTPFEVHNTGGTPSVALIIEFFTRDLTAPLPDGIVLEPLVVGVASSLNTSNVAVSLSRVTTEPGLPVLHGTTEAVNLIYVEHGTAGYIVGLGETRITPASVGAATPTIATGTPVPLEVGTERILPAESAIVSQMGAEGMIQNVGDGPLTVLILTITPAPNVPGASTPAAT